MNGAAPIFGTFDRSELIRVAEPLRDYMRTLGPPGLVCLSALLVVAFELEGHAQERGLDASTMGPAMLEELCRQAIAIGFPSKRVPDWLCSTCGAKAYVRIERSLPQTVRFHCDEHLPTGKLA